MIRHITYTDSNMTRSAEICRESAMRNGCDISTVYTYEMLNADFRKQNATILQAERGCGYWIWKPQIILQEFDHSEPGDLIVYTDAGVEFVSDITRLTHTMDDYCLLFHNHLWHHEYCKGDVLPENYTSTHQLQATAMVYKYVPKSVHLVSQWSHRCQQPGAIDDSPSVKPNQPGFKEHRHDQAILTSLAIEHNIPAHWWPAHYSYPGGSFDYARTGNDKYPIIFYHHRRRNNEW